MDENFKTALDFVLKWEGGLSDDPDDAGGRTMQGVTQRVYDAWRAANGLATRDVASIERPELEAIYSNNYWRQACCDRLRGPLDLVSFDTGVNMGPVRAVKMLQEAVGTDADGAFGNKTQQACDACVPPDAAAKYCEVRESLYKQFAQQPGQQKFLQGWLNRLNDLRVEAGIPGFSRKRGRDGDYGDTSRIERIPDIAPSDPVDKWR
jgi:lysozyme family protein